jgi:hypothetical protein
VEEAVREGSGVDSTGGIQGGGVNVVLLDGIRRAVSACEPTVSGAAWCVAADGVRRCCWHGDDGSAWWSNGGSSARFLHGAGKAPVIGWLGSDATRRAAAVHASVRGTVHAGAPGRRLARPGCGPLAARRGGGGPARLRAVARGPGCACSGSS